MTTHMAKIRRLPLAWITVWVVGGFIFVYGFGSALCLPPSLIDDPQVEWFARKIASHWKQGNLLEALRDEIGLSAGQLNPTALRHWIVVRTLTNHNTPALHLEKLLRLVTVLALGTAIIAGYARKTSTRLRWGPLGALVFWGIFCLAETLGWTNLHGLRANWFRLYCTDPLALVFLAIGGWGLIRAIDTREATKARLWTVLSAASWWFATTCKPVYFATGAGFAWVVIVALVLRHRHARLLLVVFTLASIIALLTFGITSYAYGSPSSVRTYADAYHWDLKTVLQGWRWLRGFLEATFGILPAVVLTMLALRFAVMSWRHGVAIACWTMRSEVLWLLLGVTVSLAYLPWPHPLPRYQLVPTYALAILTGMGVVTWLQLVRRLRAAVAFVLGGVGVLAVVVSRADPLVVCAVLVSVFLLGRAKIAWPAASALGMTAFAIAYLTISGVISREAFRIEYERGEHIDGEVVETCRNLIAEGQTVYLLGDWRREPFQNFALLLNRDSAKPAVIVVEPTKLTAQRGIVVWPTHMTKIKGTLNFPTGLELLKHVRLPGRVVRALTLQEFCSSLLRWPPNPSVSTLKKLHREWFVYRLGSLQLER